MNDSLNHILCSAEDTVIDAICGAENVEEPIAFTVGITARSLMEREEMNEKAVICHLAPMICRSMEWAVEEGKNLRPIFKGYMKGLLTSCQNSSRDPLIVIWYLSKLSVKAVFLYGGNIRDVIKGLTEAFWEVDRIRNPRITFFEAFVTFEMVCLLAVSDGDAGAVLEARKVLEEVKKEYEL